MESFSDYENNIENSLFCNTNIFYEPELDFDIDKPYFENIYNLYGMPTSDTINEKEDTKNKDKMNKFFSDKVYSNNQIKKDKNAKKRKGLLGRKRKGDSTSSSHSKYSDDNLRRVSKHLVLDSDFKLINKKIEEKYNGNISHGIFVKQLLILNKKNISDTSIQPNKDFLKKTLGEIFSENISSRYTTYNPCHNNLIINELINEKDKDKKNYFEKLFSITFVDSLKHFRGTQKIEELEGMKGFNDIKSKYKDDADYLKSLEYYIMNYEEILNNKRIKKPRKEKNN